MLPREDECIGGQMFPHEGTRIRILALLFAAARRPDVTSPPRERGDQHSRAAAPATGSRKAAGRRRSTERLRSQAKSSMIAIAGNRKRV